MLPTQGASFTHREIALLLSRIRQTSPLVHNVTNYVAMNFTANALLALGASPVMAHAQEEVKQLTALAQSLVLNIGTLDEAWIKSMSSSLSAARELGRPVVLDPVGAGATPYRTRTALELLERGKIHVLRGNASEILALGEGSSATKGVDSVAKPEHAVAAARSLARRFAAVVCVSGEIDFVVHAERAVAIRNGHALMPKVTAMGCACTSLIGAFLAVEGNAFRATQAAMAVMGVAGEMAGEEAKGPGTFAARVLDALSTMKESDLQERLRLEDLP
jgi:hydroxyethylthiazole kinase